MKKLILLVQILLLFAAAAVSSAETGYASWYGGKFQGRQTASGETFDTNQLTAAHKTLPFGTVVEVTNLDTGKSVQVRINDRGPFVEGRIIDLSRKAATEIGMMGTGIAPVKVEVLKNAEQAAAEGGGPENSSGVTHFSIQIASFTARENADRLHSRLAERGLTPEFENADSGHIRVVLPKINKTELDPLLTKLATMGFNSVLVRRHFTAN
ncbi:MAG: septal ring lytic transglycosylase RlpA family protein [Spirochaetota bacterium]